MEELGRRKNSRSHDGFGCGNLLRSGKKAKKETVAGLFGGQFEASQLVGVSILLLRDARVSQRGR